jgi:adenylate cyclase, class 2
MLEIELKVRVPDLASVRERLAALHATMTERTFEHDVYYNAPHRDFASTDEALRVRYSNGRVIVTYKGAKRPDFKFKAREEINIGIENGETFEKLLHRLGFQDTAVVDKVREYYRYENASIALDDVNGLGFFVEIELSGQKNAENAENVIKTIAEKIGVEGEHILSSYLELLLARR